MNAPCNEDLEEFKNTLLNATPAKYPKLEVWYCPPGCVSGWEMWRKLIIDQGLHNTGQGLMSSSIRATIYEGDAFQVLLFVDDNLDKMTATSLKNMIRGGTAATQPRRSILITSKLTRFLERSNLTKVIHFPLVLQ